MLHVHPAYGHWDFLHNFHLQNPSIHHMQTLAMNAATGFWLHPAMAELHRMYQLWPSFYDLCYLAILPFPPHYPKHMKTWRQSQKHYSSDTNSCSSIFTLFCHSFFSLTIYGSERHYCLLDSSKKRNCFNICAFFPLLF